MKKGEKHHFFGLFDEEGREASFFWSPNLFKLCNEDFQQYLPNSKDSLP